MSDTPIWPPYVAAALASDGGGGSSLGGATLKPGYHRKVCLGVDSLSAGPGDITLGPIPELAAALKSRYGDGGPGLVFFDALEPNYYGFTSSGSYASLIISNPSWSTGPRSRSLCGKGAVFTGAAGGGAGLNPEAPWDFCRIYFELTAASSSFWAAGASPSEAVYVSDAEYPLNTLCSVVVYRAPTATTEVGVYSITGGVTLYAAEFLNEGGGVTVSNCAISGTLGASMAALDDSAQRAWMELLKPSVYILNAGMNDRATLTAAGFARIAETITRRWKRGGADVLLVRPHDSSDAATTNLPSYGNVLKGLALSMGCGFLDNRDVLGATFSAANAAGNMSDNVHPSPAGTTLIANRYADAITFSS